MRRISGGSVAVSMLVMPWVALLLMGFMAMQYGCSNGFLDRAGGGQDVVTVEMPFAAGYTVQCVQGVGGTYSHTYTSTYYDIDLDTPNDSDDLVYAPANGIAYVHSDRDADFGVHVNIDLGDGTYILLAHLEDVFVESGEEVTAGQLLGYEGDTGESTGDHLHMGRHDGEASMDAVHSTSLEGLSLNARDATTGEEREFAVSEFVCDLATGHVYESLLGVPLWHPDGTLVKTSSDPDVYVLTDGEKRVFANEDVFWSYGYDFDDVVLVSEEELACYLEGDVIETESFVQAVYEDGVVWLLIRDADDSDSYAQRVHSTGWQAVLKSWSIIASTYDDLLTASDLDGAFEDYPMKDGYTPFRDGTIVREASVSDVYVVASGVAMPVADWDTYLLMGFLKREVLWLDDGMVESVQGAVGSCSVDSYCISKEVVSSCGGFSSLSYSSTDPEDEEDVEEPEEFGENVPDDSVEDLDWIRVDGSRVGLKVSRVFAGSVSGEDVSVTGVGVNSGWSYASSNAASYETDTDLAWYDFDIGSYRVTWRTENDWALYYEMCMSTDESSDLCHENSDGTYSLCFAVEDSEVETLSEKGCQALE